MSAYVTLSPTAYGELERSAQLLVVEGQLKQHGIVLARRGGNRLGHKKVAVECGRVDICGRAYLLRLGTCWVRFPARSGLLGLQWPDARSVRLAAALRGRW